MFFFLYVGETFKKKKNLSELVTGSFLHSFFQKGNHNKMIYRVQLIRVPRREREKNSRGREDFRRRKGGRQLFFGKMMFFFFHSFWFFFFFFFFFFCSYTCTTITPATCSRGTCAAQEWCANGGGNYMCRPCWECANDPLQANPGLTPPPCPLCGKYYFLCIHIYRLYINSCIFIEFFSLRFFLCWSRCLNRYVESHRKGNIYLG